MVAPGADPGQFGLAINGAESVRLDNGAVVIGTASGEIRQRAPVLYQEVAGVRRAVAGGYTLRQDGSVGFAVGAYDRSEPLVIDPVSEVYGTYLGGSGSDVGNSIAVDSSGNAYLTGATASTNFPTRNPIQPSYAGGGDDVFVTKINPAGTALVYSTYLGGTGSDDGKSIAIDSGGNVYLAGITTSTDFPTMNPIQSSNHSGLADAFIAKINASGSALVYSTYLGGSGDDEAKGIAVDNTGNAYVTGDTSSTNFPTLNPLQSSYGGGAFDAFITTVNASGSALVYSTYLGGSSDDYGTGIAVDGSGNAYLTGDTTSTDFPVTNALQTTHGGSDDAFVTEINAAGSALVYSTYLGGSGSDIGKGIAVDSSGNAYLTGYTLSTNFPTVNPIQPSSGGFYDAIVVKIKAAPPPTPTGLHVTGATTSAVYFDWTNPDPTANLTVSDGTTAIPLAPGTTSFARTGVPAGGYVCLSIAAWNANGASAWSGWVCGVVVPQVPTGLHVSGATNSGISFAWTAPDASSAIALGTGTTGGTTYTGLVPSTTTSTKAVAAGYWACAQVAAYNISYASAFTPWTCGLAVPNAPTAIHVTGHTPSSVSFGWTDSDPYSGIAVSNGSVVSTVPAGGTTYTQNGMATGSWACVSLAAYNSSGASPWSAASTGWVCGQAT